MKAYFAFTQKELLESLRTYKLLIMIIVFMFFGMLGPLTAKLTPQILESLMPAGMQVTMGEPTAFDSWAQFFKNVSQMGFIVVAILFSGIMANEFNRGTLIHPLTKGLPRSTVIFSKFTVASMIWTISYLISFGLSYGYTKYFWDSDGVLNLPFAIFCLWLFGIMFLAVILLGGVIFKSSYGCIMFIGAFIVTLFLLKSIQNKSHIDKIFRAYSIGSIIVGLIAFYMFANGFNFGTIHGERLTVLGQDQNE